MFLKLALLDLCLIFTYIVLLFVAFELSHYTYLDLSGKLNLENYCLWQKKVYVKNVQAFAADILLCLLKPLKIEVITTI